MLIAAIVGVISPSGKEVGPFLSIEQASLSQIVSDDRRTEVFAWYNLAGSLIDRAGRILRRRGRPSGWKLRGTVGPAVYQPVIWATPRPAA
ncbi:MAG: hypothetical protein QM775_07445 [Pirellulales bacterium]